MLLRRKKYYKVEIQKEMVKMGRKEKEIQRKKVKRLWKLPVTIRDKKTERESNQKSFKVIRHDQ